MKEICKDSDSDFPGLLTVEVSGIKIEVLVSGDASTREGLESSQLPFPGMVVVPGNKVQSAPE